MGALLFLIIVLCVFSVGYVLLWIVILSILHWRDFLTGFLYAVEDIGTHAIRLLSPIVTRLTHLFAPHD